jgi:phage-related protein
MAVGNASYSIPGRGITRTGSNIRCGIARILFIFCEGEIVLLHGFIKKTQKLPKEELDLARKRAKKYKQNEGL